MNPVPALVVAATTLFAALPATAHDSWVQTNVHAVEVGKVVHVDLMLGNHGNHHRDFKLAGKVDPQHATLEAIGPGGETVDLRPGLVDLGSESNPGYWSARFQPEQAGLYTIAHTYDRVVHYAPARSIKSAKTFVLATDDTGEMPSRPVPSSGALGHPLELVLQTDPATIAEPDATLTVQLLFRDEPLPDTRVSFIPRGHELQEHFDADYERRTDPDGIASFTAKQSNYYLIIAHHEDPDARGELNGDPYETTKFSAAMVIHIP